MPTYKYKYQDASEFLSIDDLPEEVRCKDGNLFNPDGNNWLIGGKQVDMNWLNEVQIKLQFDVRKTCMRAAIKYKFISFRRIKNHLKDFFLSGGKWLLSEEGCIKFIGHYAESRRQYARSALIFFLETISENDLIDCINKLDLSPKNKYKGPDYLSTDPNKGALTDTEVQALLKCATQSAIDKKISIEDYTALILLLRSGRRHSQLCDIKFKDLKEEKNGTRVLSIPRVKDGNAKRAQFRNIKISEPSLWKLLESLKQKTLNDIETKLKIKIKKKIVGELPLFINKEWLEKNATKEGLETDLVTMRAHCGAFAFSNRIYKLGPKLQVPSERNVEYLHITPKRLRETLCSKIVRKRIHPAIGAYLMDHLSTKTMKSYTKPADLAEIVKLAIELMAPIGRAFAGKPVEVELDAVNGNNPLSRCYNDQFEEIGNCSASDLGDSCRPLDCFTCGFFQPRLHANYNDLRNRVASQILEYLDEGYPDTVILPLLSLLHGIDSVIVECEKIKKETSND